MKKKRIMSNKSQHNDQTNKNEKAPFLLANPQYYISRATLKKALDNREFYPWFQPIVCSKNAKIVGCEVLARWERPGGVILPSEFIPSTEKYRLTTPLIIQLMHKTGYMVNKMRNILPEGFHFGVNVCAMDITNPDFVCESIKLNNILKKRGVGLIIEITERTPFSEHYETVATLSYLRDAGMLIALDDFCTGHSSFKYIQQFAVDFLKIDKSFT
ncbi:EAL domain-containing protein, partial [Salmonella enterica subsp. enterica serovar Kentucky]|nr:EAL domain-containing protein [Salmonella enterica subsp. enterica serovar Kentucky]EBO1589136.1 EAL domain-containing protein [Salmonella enterica subsp. enterica serovar Kentucky]EHR9875764.1 EAL domain-containing protein [Salmonella enterica subsp. enterica serovar Kentucky]ELU3209714.1 EAL domain-containing protein [Salmonella enterica subsp. enterica serovar Kentucky]